MVSSYTRIIYKGLLQLYILVYTCYEAQHSFESVVSWVLAVKPAQRILLPLSIRWAKSTVPNLHISTGTDTAFKGLVMRSIMMPNTKVILFDVIRVL